MAIPKADFIRTFQAPDVDKLLGRCETKWNGLVKGNLTMRTRELRIPLCGETEEMCNEVITIFTEQDLGYEFEQEHLEEVEEDGWTTGYLIFKW
jgi:hypothetical protein